MTQRNTLINKCILLAVPFAALLSSSPARAYIDLAPTLVQIINNSTKITVVEVTEFNRDQRDLVLKDIRALRGQVSTEPIHHMVAMNASSGQASQRPVPLPASTPQDQQPQNPA